MEIIDFEKKGNVVRFYLGNSTKDYHGDDWDDTPYEHNAGMVYPDFIEAHFDIAFPFDWSVLEPADGELNSYFCKNDFKKRKTPCIIAFKPEQYDWLSDSYRRHVGQDGILKFYYGDDINDPKFKLKESLDE